MKFLTCEYCIHSDNSMTKAKYNNIITYCKIKAQYKFLSDYCQKHITEDKKIQLKVLLRR